MSIRASDTPDLVPRRGSWTLRHLGKLILRLLGWRIEGTLPNLPKFIIALAPHTSNWDFLIGVAVMLSEDFRSHNIGSPLFLRWPYAGIMRRLGAIPPTPVEQLVDDIQASDTYILTLFPEASFQKKERWKTGYYHTARLAGIPILLGGLDYGRRTFVFGPLLVPGDDLEADARRIRQFYGGVTPKYPDNFSLDHPIEPS